MVRNVLCARAIEYIESPFATSWHPHSDCATFDGVQALVTNAEEVLAAARVRVTDTILECPEHVFTRGKILLT